MKNKFILSFVLGILLIGIVSAGITGYLTRGSGITDAGTTAILQGVRDDVATIAVTTQAGDTRVIRVREGETAKVGDAKISASDLKQGTLFTRGGANVEIEVVPASELGTGASGSTSTLCPTGQICQNEWCGLEERPACTNTGGCPIGQICQNDGFCEVEEKKFCGATSTAGHTHLSDYKYATKLLTLTPGNPTSYLSGEINCTDLGSDYVVLGGGFSISGLNSDVIFNGPIQSVANTPNGPATIYRVKIIGPASGQMAATCARIEPTLHQFSLDY